MSVSRCPLQGGRRTVSNVLAGCNPSLIALRWVKHRSCLPAVAGLPNEAKLVAHIALAVLSPGKGNPKG